MLEMEDDGPVPDVCPHCELEMSDFPELAVHAKEQHGFTIIVHYPVDLETIRFNRSYDRA